MESRPIGNPGASPSSNGNSARGQSGHSRSVMYLDRLDNSPPAPSGVTVHVDGIFIMQQAGLYDVNVTLRRQQLRPTAMWPPPQVGMTQSVSLGNGVGFNGEATQVQRPQANLRDLLQPGPGTAGTVQSAGDLADLGSGFGTKVRTTVKTPRTSKREMGSATISNTATKKKKTAEVKKLKKSVNKKGKREDKSDHSSDDEKGNGGMVTRSMLRKSSIERVSPNE